MVEPTDRFREALESHSESFGVKLSEEAVSRLCDYFQLLNKWNPRLHLVAPCPPEEFATLHILESLLLMRDLPPGSSVADIGSGGGLPIIPNLIARPDVTASLIESSVKKAVFLREALKETKTSTQATVVVERFEHVAAPEVAFVTCRALDSFQELLPQIVKWSPASTLLLFGGPNIATRLDELRLPYSRQQVPGSEQRFLFRATPGRSSESEVAGHHKH